MSDLAIATWFVADDAGNSTYFPQVGTRSDSPEAQAVYWRCIVGFYASSLKLNPTARHIFFTNTFLPQVDGLPLDTLFAQWGVEVVAMPITYRLPKDAVSSWGNQFYIFDVIDHVAARDDLGAIIVLDSDMVWRQPATDMAQAIAQHGALTYALGEDEYAIGQPINGRTRGQMARFLARHGGPQRETIPYYGGELYAATAATNRQIAEQARRLWPSVVARQEDAPLEEAHFLSIIYAALGLAEGTGNRFVRRMWTTFHHHNLKPEDAGLTLWHLPAEKKTGFADLFRLIAARPEAERARPAEMALLAPATYARLMGWPRRGLRKLVRDLSMKIMEKLAR